MAKKESNQTQPGPAPKRVTSWFRQPMLVYITMVAAFAVCAVFVIHYVIVAQKMGRP